MTNETIKLKDGTEYEVLNTLVQLGASQKDETYLHVRRVEKKPLARREAWVKGEVKRPKVPTLELHAYLAGKCIAVFTDRSYAEQFVRTFDFTPNQVTLVEVLPTEQPTTVEGFVAWHPEHGVRPATEDGGVFLAEDVELHTFSRSDKRQGWKPRRATLVLGEVEK